MVKGRARAVTVASVLDALPPAQRERLLARNPHLRPALGRATDRGERIEARAHRDGDLVTLVAKGLRLDATPNSRGHWSATAGKRAREREVIGAALRGIAAPAGPWRVVIVRVGPRPMDDDNRIASAKGCRDAVAAWLGVDDGDGRVVWEVSGEVARGYAVRVLIEGSAR